MTTMSVKGRRVEKTLAKQVGGKQQPGSGSINARRLKGDVVTDDILWDNKLTGKAAYSVTFNTLKTLEKQALDINKIPVLTIEFENQPRYAVVRIADFLEMRRIYENAVNKE